MAVIWNRKRGALARTAADVPADVPADKAKAPHEMTVAELKVELNGRGVFFDAKARKPELMRMLEDEVAAAAAKEAEAAAGAAADG